MDPAVDPLVTEDDLLQALHAVLDPEFGLSVVDLGLVYDVRLAPDEAVILLTLTTPSCPLHAVIVDAVRRAAAAAAGRPARVALTFEPPWTPARITPRGRARLGA